MAECNLYLVEKQILKLQHSLYVHFQLSKLVLRNFRPFISGEPHYQLESMADLANENTCVVCFKNVLYYSIGECDHPVCFECSTRMRVLCLQNECPICRKDLARVVFTDTIQPYKELRNKAFSDRMFERQFKIGFCNDTIKQMYERLLENRCNICDKQPPFRNFSMLNDHMRKVHEKYYCDLCVKHLKIFTSERKCYTRQELAHHRRKGDLDDTSHRGHPLCEFCEERFMDADELYRHLRKEHLYCHLCDADGKNLYYPSHQALAHHFRTDHFLCEEGDCAGQHLTAVFRSEIDLKAHKATVHGRGMTRGASRQARTLELQFNITPHPVLQRAPREPRPEPPPPPPAPRVDPQSEEHFPRLSSASAQPTILPAATARLYKGPQNLARTDKNFPTLGGGAGGPSRAPAPPSTAPTVAATILRNSKPGVSIQLQSKPASASNFRLQPTSGSRISVPRPRPQDDDDDDFPSLTRDDHPSIGAAAPQPPKVAVINSQEMQALRNNHTSAQQKKPPLSSEAFPALSSNAAPAAPPQWITVSKPKDKKPSKPEPPPRPREPAFNPVADFPTLPVNAKTKNKRQPQPPPQPQPQPPPPAPVETKVTKKEKKKQNGRKENAVEVPLVNGVDKKYARDPSFTDVNVENNNVPETKIKTVETVTVNSEKNRNVQGKGDFALAAEEYPPLSAGGSRPPPGFAPRPPCDGMTFTNSSGQTFPAPVHAYIPPPDFERRNRALFKKFTEALGGPAAVERFKEASRAFRDGLAGAEQFYSHCRGAMGASLDDVFPDLVALLPDISKQQELAARDGGLGLEVCAACGQLLAQQDVAHHRAKHWPPLGH